MNTVKTGGKTASGRQKLLPTKELTTHEWSILDGIALAHIGLSLKEHGTLKEALRAAFLTGRKAERRDNAKPS